MPDQCRCCRAAGKAKMNLIQGDVLGNVRHQLNKILQKLFG